MNIYFSCSITGGRAEERIYQAIVNDLLNAGHEVPTAHLSHSNVLEFEEIVSPDEVFARDMNWLQNCDAVIAEVTSPSHGVGYEIAVALHLNKPVLCCYQQGRKISKIITGNSAPTLRTAAYKDAAGAVAVVEAFLQELEH